MAPYTTYTALTKFKNRILYGTLFNALSYVKEKMKMYSHLTMMLEIRRVYSHPCCVLELEYSRTSRYSSNSKSALEE